MCVSVVQIVSGRVTRVSMLYHEICVCVSGAILYHERERVKYYCFVFFYHERESDVLLFQFVHEICTIVL